MWERRLGHVGWFYTPFGGAPPVVRLSRAYAPEAFPPAMRMTGERAYAPEALLPSIDRAIIGLRAPERLGRVGGSTLRFAALPPAARLTRDLAVEAFPPAMRMSGECAYAPEAFLPAMRMSGECAYAPEAFLPAMHSRRKAAVILSPAKDPGAYGAALS